MLLLGRTIIVRKLCLLGEVVRSCREHSNRVASKRQSDQNKRTVLKAFSQAENGYSSCDAAGGTGTWGLLDLE